MHRLPFHVSLVFFFLGMSITAVIDVVAHAAHKSNNAAFFTKVTPTKTGTCLLYTSDAADE